MELMVNMLKYKVIIYFRLQSIIGPINCMIFIDGQTDNLMYAGCSFDIVVLNSYNMKIKR